MSEIITCPSGLTGRIRGMKTREERFLADRKLAKAGAQLDPILAACWEETLDPGPYDFGDRPVDWPRVLVGDRFFTLIQIRVASYGADYSFSIPCENRGCRAKIEWELSLLDLPVAPLSDESRAAYLAANRFEARLPDAGRRAWFHLLTGNDERRMAQLRKGASERPISTLLQARLDQIEGVESRDNLRFIEDMAMSDVSFLLGEFDRVDCGVETEIEIECPECLGSQSIELPFEKGFFLPTKKTACGRR
jgi:hypothetical protein